MDALPHDVVNVSKFELEPFKQGRRVGCYLLGKTIGEGSFAKVKEAIHIVTGEKVAVKIIDKKRAREDRYISKNLRREARILQLVRHANIIQLLEVLETDHYYYLVMEYCAGGELLDYICTRKRLEESTCKRLVSQLVSAVDSMHQSGIVHRDLKIENFLLNENEDLKIIDFGLSNTMPSKCLDEYEQTGIFPQLLNTHCGSPAYAAPELLAQKQYGPQVDIWSIGINMYAMLTGFLPYMMEPFNVMEMYEKMMQRKMTPVPGFLSKECRDLLMRLLEPVPDWRITLRQVMRHKWFTGTSYIPRSISLGDMMYHKKELCESVLTYMKYGLKIKTKDTINAVVSNRAVHASAIYHLLVTRLDRYLRERKNSVDNAKQFSTVEVIKKASLTNENDTNKSSRSKRFSFQGKKIDPSSRSQPSMVHDNNKNIELNNSLLHEYKSQIDYHEDGTSKNLQQINIKVMHEIVRREKNKENRNTNGLDKTEVHRTKDVKRHKRSASSADANAARDSMRNSLSCDSQEDLSKLDTESNKTGPLLVQNSEDNFKTSRKMSFDNTLNNAAVPADPNNMDESCRKKLCYENREIKKTKLRKTSSLDASDTDSIEDNASEQKEACPGWSITKIIKQRPLKTENSIRDEVQKTTENSIRDEVQKTTENNIRDEVHKITAEEKGEHSMNVLTYKTVPVKRVSNPELHSESKDKTNRRSSDTNKTIKRPKTPENLKTIKLPETTEKLKTIRRPKTPDFDHHSNIEKISSDTHKHLSRSHSDNPNTTSPKPLPQNLTSKKRDTATPELDEILQNVRYINQHHIKEENNNRITDIDRLLSTPESDGLWKPPDKETMRTIHDSKTRTRRMYSPQDGESPVNISPWRQQKCDSPLKDENNNKLPGKRIGIPTEGFVKNRMARLKSLDLDNERPPKMRENKQKKSTEISTTINKIVPAKKTLELNVKQFAQYKTETTSDDKESKPKNAQQRSSLVALQPLQINFNFKIKRAKKAYTQKQQTRSLTDITTASNVQETRPTEKQILSQKNKYNDDKNDMSRQIDQGKTYFVPLGRYPKMRHHASMSIVDPTIPESVV